MTISSTTLRKEYNGNGVTTSFSFPYRFLADSHLLVYVDDVLMTLTTDYTVTGAGGPSGGSVVFGTAPAAGTGNVVILNNPPQTQELDLVENDPLPAEEVEKAFDLAAIRDQRLQDQLDRAFKLADTDTSGASTELPSPAAANLIGWNANANALQNYDADALGIEIAYASWVTETFSGDTLTTDFVLVGDPAVASNCDVAIGGVTQTAGIDFTYTRATQTISFTSAPLAGADNVAVRYGRAVPVGTVPAGTVGDAQIVDGSVTEPKLADGSVTSAKISPAYDATLAKLNAAQNFDAPQRSAPLTDNDLSFDLGAKQNFTSTPTAGGALTFTNLAAGLNGNILLVNGSNYAITKAANVKCNASFLSAISATGTYWISYYSDGTNVHVSTAGALS